MTDRRALLAAEFPTPSAEAPAEPENGTSQVPPPQPPRPKLRVGHYLILVSLNCIGGFASDCYIPNLADIVDDLKASDQLVSLTIQINWILLGLATPIVGHLSDVYGRKVVVWCTLSVFVVGALGSGFAPTIEWLLAARCVQGVGESVSIITSAIIRDEVDDKQERMKVQAYFSTMRPLMLIGGPSFGGFIGNAIGWRALMWGLSGWGAINMLLMYFIPESNQQVVDQQQQQQQQQQVADPDAPKLRQQRACKSPCGILCPELNGAKFRRMATNVDFIGLTVCTAICMGAVRSLLSTISFVYTHYYELSTPITGLLISVPLIFGFLASLVAAQLAAKTSPARLMRVGMLAGVITPITTLVIAGLPGCLDCLYAAPRWYMTTLPCALIAAVNFFALPAMEVCQVGACGKVHV